jgi:predicted transcriptional regulator
VTLKQTTVQLSDELLETLDREAAARGASRSALVRQLLGEALADDRERHVGEAIAAGYRRIPQDTPDEWGDLAASNRRSNRETMQRLDAEERAAGFDPW